MYGISVVIAQVLGRSPCQRKYSCNSELSPMMSQVTNRANNTVRLENTSWNVSFHEAKDINFILSQGGRRTDTGSNCVKEMLSRAPLQRCYVARGSHHSTYPICFQTSPIECASGTAFCIAYPATVKSIATKNAGNKVRRTAARNQCRCSIFFTLLYKPTTKTPSTRISASRAGAI